MSLKHAKYVLYASCTLMVVLMVAGGAAKRTWPILLGGAAALVGLVFWILFGRCRRCGRFLGRVDHKYCPHCGERIEW